MDINLLFVHKYIKTFLMVKNLFVCKVVLEICLNIMMMKHKIFKINWQTKPFKTHLNVMECFNVTFVPLILHHTMIWFEFVELILKKKIIMDLEDG